MDVGPALWLVMTAGGAALLAAVLAWAMLATRRRSPSARGATEAATLELYRAEEAARHRREEGGAATAAGPIPNDRALTVTRARQAVTGHNVSIVLRISLILALIAGIFLVGRFWKEARMLPGQTEVPAPGVRGAG